MKLLHVADRFGWSAGGGDRYLEDILEPLQQAGMDNAVIYRNGNPDRLDLARQAIEIPGFMRFTGSAPDSRLRLRQVLHATCPDAALVYCLPNPSFGAALARSLPTILFAQDYEAICPAGTQWWRFQSATCNRTTGLPCLVNAFTKGCSSRRPAHLLSSYYRAAASKGWLRDAHVIAVSSFVRKRFLAAGFSEHRVHVVRYPFAPAVSIPAPRDPNDTPTVLFVGRVSREKGLDHLLRALSLLREIPWTLLVAGDGPDIPPNEQLAISLGLQHRVRFAGWLAESDLESAYGSAALVAVPSLWPDPYPLVGPEAMIRGRPVVGYASGGIPEWIIHGETGLSVPTGDVTALAAALRDLLNDPGRREAMGLRAREWVIKAHSPEHHLRDLRAVIDRAIAGYGETYAPYRRRPHPANLPRSS
jgi:glycosyltransferase involved in cell wall biosynthesis